MQVIEVRKEMKRLEEHYVEGEIWVRMLTWVNTVRVRVRVWVRVRVCAGVCVLVCVEL